MVENGKSSRKRELLDNLYVHNINTNMLCRQFGRGHEFVYILSPIFRKRECRYFGVACRCKFGMNALDNKSYCDPCP